MKTYLVLMCGPGSIDNLRELIDPVRAAFDGVVAVLHDSRGSAEDEYLESVKGCGVVIHLPFCRRHSFSRNHYLWAGPIEEGSWIVQLDHLERLNTQFAANLRHFISGLAPQGINTVFYYGKAFIYQQHESLEFVGSPHEGLRRHDGKMQAAELSQHYPVETDVRYSVRHLKRDTSFSWIGHYARYYVEYPYGSNHCLLGNVDRGDEMTIFRQREYMRNTFRDYMRLKGVPLTTESIVQYWRDHPLDEAMRRFVNGEKILNDLYRYRILNDLMCVDEHKWISLKVV